MKEDRSLSLPVLGWREWVRLPSLGVGEIKAKVDTGARTSTLHAFELQLQRRKSKRWAVFTIHPYQRDVETSIAVEAEIVDERVIRSSNGKTELRPVISTPIELGGMQWLIEITLTNRDQMGFRMLLGRNALHGRFFVDPSHSYLQGQLARLRRSRRPPEVRE